MYNDFGWLFASKLYRQGTELSVLDLILLKCRYSENCISIFLINSQNGYLFLLLITSYMQCD